MSKFNETVAYSTITWNSGDILEAAFMFPTHQFETEMELDCMSDTEFCNMIEAILEPLQPIPNIIRHGLAESVRSGNRIRVYSQSLKLSRRHAFVLGETQKTDVPDAKLGQVFGYHGHIIVDENKPTETDIEIAQNSWEVAEALATEVA